MTNDFTVTPKEEREIVEEENILQYFLLLLKLGFRMM
jgi:hypothetical protein